MPEAEWELQLEQAVSGDRQARAAVVRGLQDVWFRFCMARLGQPERAREATQETAVRFLDKLSTFRGDSHVRTWSLGIARLVCLEMSRPSRVVSGVELAGVEGPAAEASEPIDVLAAVRGLPARQAEAVTLRYLEGLSTKDTAEAMGCAQGTVKATLAKALKALRGRLAKDVEHA